jgi:hypothetical protein
MTIAINDLIFVHSGGAANESPAADLGGAISTATNKRVKSQSASLPVNVTGVVITDAMGNDEGVGSLKYTAATHTISWKPFGQSTYYGVAVGGSGEFLIGSSAGYLVVTVTYASLPATDQTDSITISANLQNVFDTVTASQALIGKTSYRCLYILNKHATDTAVGVTVWVSQNTPAGDEIDIGLGTAAIGATEQTIGNETTAPSGVTFSHPITYGTGLAIGNIAAGSYKALWQRRIVPANTRGTVISNSAVIAVAATI